MASPHLVLCQGFTQALQFFRHISHDPYKRVVQSIATVWFLHHLPFDKKHQFQTIMKTRSAISTAALCVLFSAGFTAAQPAGEGPGRDARILDPDRVRALAPGYLLFDQDRDGLISAEELAAAPRILSRFDLNNDGTITREEWIEGRRRFNPDGEARPERPERPERPIPRRGGEGVERPERPERPAPQRVPPLFALLDQNNDGVICPEELAAAPRILLAALDANKDGQITLREYRRGIAEYMPQPQDRPPQPARERRGPETAE